MNLHHNLRRNRKGIGTIFAMVFFLLIVMIVFASFMIILNQNTGLEQATIQAKQLDLDRYTELETVSIANPETAVLNNVVCISCSLTDNGTLPTEFVRLWIKDITQNKTGNIIMTPAITLQPGSSTYYFNSTYVANAGSYDQFSFWFITARGNTISAYPAINQFNAITSNGTFPGVANMNSTYATNNTPLQLSLNTTMPNQLIYVVVSYDDGNTLYTPTSSPSLTWTLRGASSSTDYYSSGDSILKTFYAIDPSSGPITISIQSTADELSDYYCSALAFAISGVNTTSPFDGSAQISIGQSTMPQDTITTHYSNDFVIGALGIDDLNPAITQGAGFAQIMPVQSSYGASGEPNSMPRSVWSEWSIIQAPRTNLPVNCTFTSTKAWAIIVDAVKLVIIPPVAPVSLFPTSGPIGQPVTVSGQGFAANSRLLATFGGSQIPFSFTTDGSGNIPPGATFTVPLGSTAGNKTVTIIDSSFNYANTTFQVTTPNITVSPTSGPVGTNVTVTGSNFIDNSNITINFDGNSTVTNPSTVTANATGQFSATFNFNLNDTAGVKQVLASDGVNSASANFTVTPSITLSPTNGLIGSSVNVTGSGFAASQPVIVTFAGSTIQTIPVSFNTNGVGFFNASFTIPTGQTAGGKTVNATDASSNSAIATFTVTPSISLNPTIGNVGSTVTVSGSGFAGNSALTATFAGSTVTISGTTSTNSSGSFTGANFTVPIWVPTWATGSVQTVIITDAASNSGSNTYTVNTVSQSITVAMTNSAPSATVTVNGGNPNPNTFAADGNSHSITMFAGSPFTLSFSNSGNTQDGFIMSNAFSATSPSYTSDGNAKSVTAYEQVKNTFSTTFNGGNPGGSDSLVLTGTYLGTPPSTIATLNSANGWSASPWSDYNTAVTFPASTTLSGSNARWVILSAYSTSPLTAGGNPYAQTYYHQYSFQLDYAVSGSGSPTSPTLTATQFGSSYTPTLGTSLVTYWLDSGQTWSVTNPLGGSGSNERWDSRQTVSGTVSSSSPITAGTGTLTFTYYHQYLLTVTGGNGVTYGTASPTGDNWYDSGGSTTVRSNGVWNRSGGSGQRVASWNLDGGSNTALSSTSTVTTSSISMTTYHTVNFNSVTQYQVTLDSGATSALSSITSPTISGDNYWYDSGTSVTLILNGVYGRSGGSGTRISGYAVNGGSNTPESTTGTFTVLNGISISAPQAITTTTVTQYQVTLDATSTSALNSITSPTVSSDNYWYDSGTSVSVVLNGVWGRSGGTGTRLTGYVINGGSNTQTSTTGTVTVFSGTISNHEFVTATSVTQYQVTFSQTGVDSSAGSNTVLTVGSTPYAYNALPSSVWVDSGTTFTWASTVSGGTGKQFAITGSSGASPITASGTFSATYTTQYQLTMVTNFGTTTPAVGNTWYNAGSTVTISATAPMPGAGEQYVWNGWTGIGSGSYTGTNNPATSLVTMNAAITETASWTHQYQVSFAVSPSGSGTTSPSGTNVWENAGALSISASYNPGYQFSVWSATGTITITSASSASTTATISGTGTITATFTVTPPTITAKSAVASSLSLQYSVTQPNSFVVIVVTGGYYRLTGVTPPAGFTQQEWLTGSDNYESAYIAVNTAQATGSYTVSCNAAGSSGISIAVYVFAPGTYSYTHGNSVGSTSASLTLAAGANYYIFGGSDGNGAMSLSTSTIDVHDSSNYSTIGHQITQSASVSSSYSRIIIVGIGITRTG